MQYEILRDLLIIVVSITAVFGVLIGGLVFFLLRTVLVKDITTEVDRRVDKECRRLRGQSKTLAGVTYWLQHSYDTAINITKQALTESGDVLSESDLIFAKSNLGYYYAEKHKQQPLWKQKEEAIDLTRIGFEKYSASIPEFQKPDWIDNFVFVKAVFTQTSNERDELVQLINELLLRTDLALIHAYLKESKQYILLQDLTQT